MDSSLFYFVLSIHIIAVISWMAGLLYLPRLFIYHTKVKKQSEAYNIFQIMEKRLLRIIMNPAMVVVFITGLYMIYLTSFNQMWIHIKLLLVLILAIFHGFLARCYKNFVISSNKYSEKFYRIINEVPTVIMIAIVFLVIFKP